jgi:hypothetical protein
MGVWTGHLPLEIDSPQSRRSGAIREREVSLFGWLFRNRQTGKVTIAQFPNLPLWCFFAAVVLRRVVPLPETRALLSGVELSSLAWWALGEVLRGVNPWRRLLGIGGCAFVVVGVVTHVK